MFRMKVDHQWRMAYVLLIYNFLDGFRIETCVDLDIVVKMGGEEDPNSPTDISITRS